MATRRPIWRYGLFQIPALLLVLCLSAAGATYLLYGGCQRIWALLFLGLSWVAFTWMITMPIDYLLRFGMKLQMSLAGRIAIANALFWTVLTTVVLASTLPSSLNQCAASELVSLDWAQWRADIWNEMFYEDDGDSSAPIGSEADFRFVVTKNRRIQNVEISTPEAALENYIQSRIDSIEGSDVLRFVPGTRRSQVEYESNVRICDGDTRPGCGEPADPESYADIEEYNK